MKRISWKSINSWIMFALLLAPGLYLFGGYIGQLAGSHGEFMYAEPAIEGGIDYSVQYDGNTYQRYMYDEVYFSDYSPETGTYFQFGYNTGNKETVYALNNSFVSVDGVTLSNSEYYIRWENTSTALYSYNLKEGSCFTYWRLNQAQNRYIYYEVYYINEFQKTSIYWLFNKDPGLDTFTQAYHGTETLNLNIASHESVFTKTPNVTLNWVNERNIPDTQPTTIEQPQIEPNAQGNTEFQQGQFFSRNNFLKKWGDSVVSQDETWGFAPFKALIQYLDNNMLHFAPNGVQYGLMAYGYMYYTLHIVLLDLVFYITSFLPRILKKLAERLEGGLD